jgi:cytochrome P450
MSDFVVAGVESLTSSIRWTLLHLATNPDCMDKLRKELDGFLKNSSMKELSSYSSRNELPYLEAVIAESLRKCPAVHTIVHVTHEDFIAADHFIPKGTWVMGNIWAVHHDPKVFQDPETFQPERFLEPREDGIGKSLKKDLIEKCFSFSTGEIMLIH